MFHQIIGLKNVVNYWILALPWWIGLKQEDPRFSPFRKEIPSLLISLNFHTKNNNLTSAEVENVLWQLRRLILYSLLLTGTCHKNLEIWNFYSLEI
jgi:hypothetical protein